VNVQKEARRDARAFARAAMYYGEGAGTRRKLITATVDGKAQRNPAYGRAFHMELARQDMAYHAAKARRERELKDVGHAFGKNVRGILTGDVRSVNTGVLVLGATAYVAHQTGLDKLAYDKAKKSINDFKARRRAKKTNIHLITDLK
jgi:predicted alpha/beta hydrolase